MKIVHRSFQYETEARILTRLTKSHIILRKRIEEAVKSLNTISPSVTSHNNPTKPAIQSGQKGRALRPLNAPPARL